jgi:transcriptional regulator with XRE-family HTH domain
MKTRHEVLMEDPEFRRLLSIEALVAEASEVIARLMAEQNVSKADLARRLNKSRAWVTQLLSGKANMTVRTLAEVVYALDSEVKLRAQPPSSKAAGKPAGTGWQPAGRRREKASSTTARYTNSEASRM